MIDILSWIMGRRSATGTVVVDGENVDCTDDGEGNITVTVTTTEEEG